MSEKMVTNYVKGSYKELYDIATTPNKPTLIGIHTPTSIRPVAMLQGFWSQYKKFKYKGCKIALVPVHTRPLDVQQIGTQAGLNQTNPKDLLNPVLSKGYIGESLGYYFDQYFNAENSNYTRVKASSADINIGGTSGETFKNWYYQNLIAKGWRKTAVNEPLTMSGLRPRLWALGVNHPIQPPIVYDTSGNLSPGSFTGLGAEIGSNLTPMMSIKDGDMFTGSEQGIMMGPGPSDIGGLYPSAGSTVAPGDYVFSTYRTVPISWQDTIVNTLPPNGLLTGGTGTNSATTSIGQSAVYSTLAKHFMAVIILPPSETTVMYWRMVITHYYAFRGFRYTMVNAAGRGSVGNSVLPVSNTSAQNALTVNQPYTINWPEDTSSAKGIYNVDGETYVADESGTVDVINGSVDFVSDAVS